MFIRASWCGRALVVAGVVTMLTVAASAQVAVDLNQWTKEGNPNAGNWILSLDGSSVLQTVNNAPTYYVSDTNVYNTTIRGSFGVETTSDDDFIGFVFGYQAPLSANADDPLAVNYILFDWKQLVQGGADSGFRLAHVQGVEPGNHAITNPMWTFTNTPDLTFTIFDTRTGPNSSGLGWANHTHYDFELLYEPQRIKIDIKGGTGQFETGQTIFDVAYADIEGADTLFGTAFPEGRFGFYNHSQAQVRYQSFTEQANPVLSTIPADGETLDFGLVRVGDTAEADLTIANAGGAGAASLSGNVASPDNPFARTDAAGFSLGEGESIDEAFTFTPTSRGTFQQDVLITSNDPVNSDVTVGLTGTGVGPVFSSSITPDDTLDFGDAQPAASLNTLLQIANITIDENGGNADLTDMTLNYVITGDHADLFSVNLANGTKVGDQDAVDILVSFLGEGTPDVYSAILSLLTDEGAALGDTLNGQSYSFILSATVVPEPGSLALLLISSTWLLRRTPAMASHDRR